MNKEILKFASDLSYEYYGKPLVIVDNGDETSKRILELAGILDEYEVSDGFVNHRMCVSSKGRGTFGLKGMDDCHNKYYAFSHVQEVYKEAVGDDVLDCLIITAMRHKANVIVNPFGVDDE